MKQWPLDPCLSSPELLSLHLLIYRPPPPSFPTSLPCILLFFSLSFFSLSLCSPASALLHTCAKIRGGTWGCIDLRSCEMTSLVSDLPVYI